MSQTKDTDVVVKRRWCGKGYTKPAPEVYFWMSIEPMMDDRGCWEWIGDRFKRGYGRVKEGVYAHRFSYQLHNGPLPKGTVVLHLCDNVSCVNPRHLRAGTQLDNMRDKCAKGRQARFCAPPDVPCRNGHVGNFLYHEKFNKVAGKSYMCRICKTCRHEYNMRKKAA